jgi:tRNA G18 (ribose-2'-O)-methylase SpoU
MLHIHHIESLEDPGLAPYRTLRRTTDHEKEGIFVAEGEKVVARLMESDLQVFSVLITEEWLGIYRDRLELRTGTIEVFVGEKTLLSSIVGFRLHQGIMAVAAIPKAQELETIVNLSQRPRLFVAVDGMTNSENLGVVIRNCVAFGVQALIVGETSSNPYLRRAVRNSMGTIFKLPVLSTSNLAETIHNLRARFSITVVAAHPRSEQHSAGSSYLRKDCCIVFGSEGYGISEKVLAECTQAVAIPMMSGVDSLNVASASAVFLYEVMRQRKEL